MKKEEEEEKCNTRSQQYCWENMFSVLINERVFTEKWSFWKK